MAKALGSHRTNVLRAVPESAQIVAFSWRSKNLEIKLLCLTIAQSHKEKNICVCGRYLLILNPERRLSTRVFFLLLYEGLVCVLFFVSETGPTLISGEEFLFSWCPTGFYWDQMNVSSILKLNWPPTLTKSFPLQLTHLTGLYEVEKSLTCNTLKNLGSLSEEMIDSKEAGERAK